MTNFSTDNPMTDILTSEPSEIDDLDEDDDDDEEDDEEFDNSVYRRTYDCIYDLYDETDGVTFDIVVTKVEKAVLQFNSLLKEYKQGIEDGSIQPTPRPKH